MFAELLIILLLLWVPAWLRFGRGVDHCFYRPRRNAEDVAIPGMKWVETQSEDGVGIRGVQIQPKTRASGRVVLYFHGILFNPKYKLESLKRFADENHIAVLMFNYRGYCYSDNVKCSEDGIKRDAQAILDFVAREYRGEEVFVMGKSFGCAVALHMLNLRTRDGRPAEELFKALILDAPFTSAPEVIKHLTNSLLPSFLYAHALHWNNLTAIETLSLPILILHGTNDQTCPFRMSVALQKRAKAARLIRIEDAGHNSLWHHPAYKRALKALWDIKFN